MPSQLAGEPILQLLKVVEARQYVKAVEAIEAFAKMKDAKAGDAPSGPMVDLVYEIQGERIRLAEDDNR